MRKCNNCMQLKPLTDFYNDNSNKDGKQYMCIVCYKAYFKAWRASRSEAKQSVHVQSKVCFDCRSEKPISQFGKRSSSLDKHNSYCKECWRVRTKVAQRKHLLKSKNA